MKKKEKEKKEQDAYVEHFKAQFNIHMIRQIFSPSLYIVLTTTTHLQKVTSQRTGKTLFSLKEEEKQE